MRFPVVASHLIGRFFYSPRLPDFDTGLNLYGKVAPKTSLGLLGAVDVDNRSDYVVRLRRELNETDSLALSAIGRDEAGQHNQVLVVHPAWRSGDWVCLTHWAPSFDNGHYLGDALYLIFGNPNPAERFEPMVTVKVVKPF